MMKQIFCYLRGTTNIVLIHDNGSTIRDSVEDFVDLRLRSLDIKRSMTIYAFIFLWCVISQKTILQSIIALFTIKIKYMTSTKTIKEAFMIRGLIGNLDLSYELIIVHCDSQDAIYLVKI